MSKAVQQQKEQTEKAEQETTPSLTKEEIAKWHGYACINEPWAKSPPPCIYKNDALARKDYTDITRSEYQDTDEVLHAKADILINMFKKSKAAAVFVGAGIEVSCGMPDYASHDRSKPTVKVATIEQSPSPSHRVLAQMFNKQNDLGFNFASGRCFVQQNHSCMFERAGVDFNRVNNMHGVNLYNHEKVAGALGREVNPVVKMAGSLRSDLFNDILKLEEEADFCFALGSSFSGMNVERVATSCAKKHIKSGFTEGQGLAMITLQCTPVDSQCALRVFDYCDHFMVIVAEKLGVLIDVHTDFAWNTGKPQIPRRPLTVAAKEADARMKVLKAKLEGKTVEEIESEIRNNKYSSASSSSRRRSSVSPRGAASSSSTRRRSVSKSRSPSTRSPASRSPGTSARKNSIDHKQPMRF